MEPFELHEWNLGMESALHGGHSRQQVARMLLDTGRFEVPEITNEYFLGVKWCNLLSGPLVTILLLFHWWYEQFIVPCLPRLSNSRDMQLFAF